VHNNGRFLVKGEYRIVKTCLSHPFVCDIRLDGSDEVAFVFATDTVVDDGHFCFGLYDFSRNYICRATGPVVLLHSEGTHVLESCHSYRRVATLRRCQE